MDEHTTPADVRLLTRQQVTDTLGMSRTEIWRRLSGDDPDPNFPSPVRIGRMVRWRSDEVQAFIDHLSEARL